MREFAQLAFLAFACMPNAQTQTQSLVVNPRIKLPSDKVQGESLVSSLGQFLNALDLQPEKNEWVYKPQILQTAILLDEMGDVGEEGEGEDRIVFQPHLLNAIPLDGDKYFVQVSYTGQVDGVSITKANIELIAHKDEGGYVFSSPLARNTKGWEEFRIENTTFHFRGTMNTAKAKEYQALAASFDKRLKSAPKESAFYFFEDDLEVQQFIGLPYKLDYNGDGGCVGWGVSLEEQEIYLMSEAKFSSFDPHDLWHNRLSRVKPRNEVNHAVDEGIATLYGGSWGLSWDEMFAAFREKIDVSEGTDWLDLREKRIFFETKGHKNPTDFMINALFVKKIEGEKGFPGVWELLNAKEEQAYFDALADLIGITKQNYNSEVWELLSEEIGKQGD